MRIRVKVFAVLILLGLVAFPAAAGGLSKEVKKEAKQLLKGTLYMRVNAPHTQGRHPYGVYQKPLVEVSPDGVNTDGSMKVDTGFWHASSTMWVVRVNDAVEVDEIDFDDGKIELELEGTGKSDGKDTALNLVGITTVEDLHKAFDRAFSRVPLEQEHDDWPSDIRDAIASYKLLDGMTKRQAICVTGHPESFEVEEEDGAKVETWYLAQAFGLPRAITFVDGKLEGVAGTSGGTVSLDD